MKNKQTTTGHKVLTAIGIILCVILIPMLIVNITLIVKSFTNKDEVPSFGSMVPMIVLTDSMYPEIQSGDLIICYQTKPEDVQSGDIICFFDPAGNGTSTVTHRVLMSSVDSSGNLVWYTKGDNNNTPDEMPVPAENLVGVYSKRIPGAGNVAMFMQTTAGLIICVILPIILLVGYDIIRRGMYEKQKKEDTDALMAELEALRAEKEKKE